MSKRTTSLSVTRVNDLVLGAFAHVPRNEQLDHAIRYFSTWSGSECVLSILRQLLALTRTSLPHAVSYSWYGIDAKSWGQGTDPYRSRGTDYPIWRQSPRASHRAASAHQASRGAESRCSPGCKGHWSVACFQFRDWRCTHAMAHLGQVSSPNRFWTPS